MPVLELIIDGDNEPVVRELTAQEVAALEAARTALPEQIPMHKARKALRIMGPEGEADPNKWWPQVMAAIEAIPNEISRGCIMDELDTAPNLVLAGDSTTLVRQAIGMTDQQLEQVARKALTLP